MSEGSETPSRMKPKANWIWLMAWRDTRRTRGKLALFGFSVIFGVTHARSGAMHDEVSFEVQCLFSPSGTLR